MSIKSTINPGIYVEDKHKKKAKKVNTSLFLITINTNKSEHCNDKCTQEAMPGLKIYFRKLAEFLFSEKNIPNLLKLKPKWPNNPPVMVPKSDIISIEAKTNIELNRAGRGFLHSHTYIRVKHKTKLQINITLLRQNVYQFLEKPLTFNGEFKHPYVHVDAVTGDVEKNLEEYVAPKL
jgi:hypothetical protein